jgi:small-conductance mechanosensitive channel
MTEFLALLERVLSYPLFRFGSGDVTVAALLKLVAWVGAVVILERILRQRALTRLLARTPLPPGSQFGIARIFGYAFLTLGIYLGLQFAGIDVGSLAIIAGAIGVGIGFGLQNIVSNFVSGIIILIERPISLGDRVEVGGTAGDVAKISLRSTTVVTNDNISIIVPNSEFITSQVVNWSHGDPKVRMRIPFGVAYGSDVAKLKTIMPGVGAGHPRILTEPAPELLFVGFGESSLDFELSVWTSAMAVRPRKLVSDLNFAIERTLRDHGFEIPFPQRDLHVRSGAIAVRMEPDGASKP